MNFFEYKWFLRGFPYKTFYNNDEKGRRTGGKNIKIYGPIERRDRKIVMPMFTDVVNLIDFIRSFFQFFLLAPFSVKRKL